MTIKTFTTDQAVYTIETDHTNRVAEFIDGVARWEMVTTFRVMLDGKLITVCYDEKDLAMVIDAQENAARYAGMNNRFD